MQLHELVRLQVREYLMKSLTQYIQEHHRVHLIYLVLLFYGESQYEFQVLVAEYL